MGVWQALPAKETPEYLDLVAFCNNHQQEVLATLPTYAAEISASSGFDRMLSFIKKNGGVPIYISKRREYFNRKYSLALSQKEHRYLLNTADSRGTITMPSAFGVFLALRRVAIHLAMSGHKGDREIAQKYGASLRYLKKERQRIKSALPLK